MEHKRKGKCNSNDKAHGCNSKKRNKHNQTKTKKNHENDETTMTNNNDTKKNKLRTTGNGSRTKKGIKQKHNRKANTTIEHQ